MEESIYLLDFLINYLMKGRYANMSGEMITISPTPLETNVIRAFGWSLIEFEMTLYQKFLNISVDGSLLTFEKFKEILREMESKGYLQELQFQGRTAYRKMIVDSELNKVTKPSQPIDEMRLAIGGRIAKSLEKRKRKEEEPSVGQKILQALRDWLLKESGLMEIDIQILHDCISDIREAIAKSDDTTLDLLKCEYPGIKDIIVSAIEKYGTKKLLQDLTEVEVSLNTSR
jgi:hypothetical protein